MTAAFLTGELALTYHHRKADLTKINPEELDLKNPDTLGLYLVTMLAEGQLEGEVEHDSSEGTQFLIRFNKQLHKPRI